MASTVLTNLKVTGTLEAGTTKVAGVSSIDRVNDCSGTYSATEVNKIVKAVNDILTLLGKPTS